MYTCMCAVRVLETTDWGFLKSLLFCTYADVNMLLELHLSLKQYQTCLEVSSVFVPCVINQSTCCLNGAKWQAAYSLITYAKNSWDKVGCPSFSFSDVNVWNALLLSLLTVTTFKDFKADPSLSWMPTVAIFVFVVWNEVFKGWGRRWWKLTCCYSWSI